MPSSHVIDGIEVCDRFAHPSPTNYRDIRTFKGEPALGVLGGRSDETGLYTVIYEHLKGKPEIQLRLPVPMPHAPDKNWTWLYLARIDRWESELAPSRWGILKRQIAAIILDSENWSIMCWGVSLAEAIQSEIRSIGASEGSDDFYDKDGNLTDSRKKQINRTIKEMVEWGWLELFSGSEAKLIDLSDDQIDLMWLLQPSSMLVADAQKLYELNPEYYPITSQDLWESSPPSDEEKLQMENHPSQHHKLLENNSTYEEEFPHLTSLDPKSLAHWPNAAFHYANRDSPRYSVPVVPIENLMNQPSQVVMRGIARGSQFQAQTGSIQQVSEIVSVCGLDDYMDFDNGFPEAVQAVYDNPNPTKGKDVKELLDFLHDDDQLAVLQYVKSFISPAKINEAEALVMKYSGVALITETIDLVPAQRGKRKHVIRQITLLVGALTQDLIAMWSGTIVGSWPRPNEE